MMFTANFILSKYGFDVYKMEDPDKPQTEESRIMTIFVGPILCITGLITTYFTPHFTAKLERRK